MQRSLTTRCVIGLVLGILLGTAVSRLQPDADASLVGLADSLIRVWTNALRLVVTPLVIAQLFVAISTERGAKGEATKLGVLVPGVFIALMLFTALLTITAVYGLLSLPVFRELSLADLPTVGPAAAPAAGGGAGSVAWLDAVIPSNLFAAASADTILGLMVFTIAFALAARSLAPELRQVLQKGFQAVQAALFVLVDWLLRLAPFVLFGVAFRAALRSGLEIGGVLLAFVAIAIIVVLLCTAALYPVAVVGGAIPLARFARAVFPAQVAGAASRSSLATVPVLLREAEETLGIPVRISAVVIPVGGAMLKLSQAVTPPLRLLFLGHLLGLSFGPWQLAAFIVTVFLLSPSVPGVPRLISSNASLPAYIALGIPLEYVVLLAPLNAIIDPVLTVQNTTGYLTANVLVARLTRSRPVPLDTPAPAPQV